MAQHISRINNNELIELLKQSDVQLVDVRTPNEVASGIIEGAAIIDFYDPEFGTKINKLNKEKPIAVYCAAGGRSAKVANKLARLGFMKIYDLKKGFKGWESEGNPVVEP